MRSALDQMIDLAKVFSSEVMVRKDCDDRYLVDIHRVSYKENHRDIMSRSICGRARGSLEEACMNFLAEAKGKLLFGDDPAYYGENRPEYICV